MNKKIAILLAIALLISLAGCGSNSPGNDVPPSNSIESTQTPSESTETPPEATQSTSQTQDPPQSEEPAETAQTPAESEEPATSTTKQPEETAPASTPAPATSTPAHTHNYTSTITTQATCGTDGTRTYTCSCGDSYTEAIKATGNHTYNSTITKQPNCAEEGTKSNTCVACGYTYNETIARTNDHNWETVHFDAIGYYDNGGTHRVQFNRCDCGYEVTSDTPDANTVWRNHTRECAYVRFISGYKDVPNGDPQWVEIVPAYDETHCTNCGATQ